MVDQTKLEQLLANGIGGGRDRNMEIPAAQHEIKRQFGTITPLSSNVFMCTGRQVQALQHHSIDLLMVEAMPNLAWGATSSSRYVTADYPSMTKMYEGFLATAKRQLGQNWRDQLLGCNFIFPLPARKANPPLVSISFVDMGPCGARCAPNPATGVPKFAPRFKMHVFDNLMSNLFRQVLGNADILEKSKGRKIRIGVPRLYGSAGGVYAARLFELLVEAAAPHADTIELYLFVPVDNPDKALVDPIWPERKSKKQLKSEKFSRIHRNKKRAASA